MEVIRIPKGLTKQQREVIALDIIDFIKDRTFAGLDKYNKPFEPYTEAYAKKKGVKPNDVNLVLSGEMMEKLKRVRDSDGEIVIGYDGRSKKLNAKVEGNITGSYGKDPDESKARDFLGIIKKDLMDIVNTYTGEDDAESE
jgi:hypothetical protein